MEANLTGVPETMLWTLHNRVSEARKPRGLIRDADAIKIYESIKYDYSRSFGPANAPHAVRSFRFDQQVKEWIQRHPSGQVVELAAGLETQFLRVDNGGVKWTCVDVAEAIEVRERFIPSRDRLTNLACDARDKTWMESFEPTEPLFVSAQGLFMSFEEKEVGALVSHLFERFDDVTLIFDFIPRWLSRKTLKGFNITPHYQTPPMPWGISCDEVKPRLRQWIQRSVEAEFFTYHGIGRINGWIFGLLSLIPALRNVQPAMVCVRLRD
jgi:O-methyltransferase involved in polyketide biosynthesis